MTLEEAYLEHVLLHLRSEDPDDRPLRTYLDSWYARSVGPAMLERSKARPQWLNKGDLAKRPELAWHCHAISAEAEACIKIGEVSALAKDHSVPLNQVIVELKKHTLLDRHELRKFLQRRYRVAVITQLEHKRLGRGDAARKKAKAVIFEELGPYARYDCPDWGIEYRIIRK